ncbi:MAG TPA: class I lanthipeptide [Thermoanaerobaculia bacterium]
MKKTVRKLALSKETLIDLAQDHLKEVPGGITALNCGTNGYTLCTRCC